MKLFRIASRRFPIFDGTGAFLHGARWNSPGIRVIYASESISCARLEVLVHSGRASPPTNHCYVEIGIPDGVPMDLVGPEELPTDWNSVPDRRTARRFGDAWHHKGAAPLLRVPSVASANEFNVLINPDHPDVKTFAVSAPRVIIWDKRLFEA
jgi:RES domain-containing protein